MDDLLTRGASTDLIPQKASTTVSELYTFGSNYADVFSIKGSVVGEEGASGGPVLNAKGDVIGIIVTRGSSPDAKLALAQRLLDEGDVEGAIRALDTLPDAARTVLSPWLASAERRVEVDRHVAALRADALAGLAQMSRTAP